jgi:hypothetical protein
VRNRDLTFENINYIHSCFSRKRHKKHKNELWLLCFLVANTLVLFVAMLFVPFCGSSGFESGGFGINERVGLSARDTAQQ